MVSGISGLGQCGSVMLVSCSLEAALSVLFKFCGSTVHVAQGPPGFSVSSRPLYITYSVNSLHVRFSCWINISVSVMYN